VKNELNFDLKLCSLFSLTFSDFHTLKSSFFKCLQVKKHEEISVEVTAEKAQPDGEEGKQMAMKTPISLQEAQRCTSLYFALCTKVICFIQIMFESKIIHLN
jgi:hypothetical protein